MLNYHSILSIHTAYKTEFIDGNFLRNIWMQKIMIIKLKFISKQNYIINYNTVYNKCINSTFLT